MYHIIPIEVKFFFLLILCLIILKIFRALESSPAILIKSSLEICNTSVKLLDRIVTLLGNSEKNANSPHQVSGSISFIKEWVLLCTNMPVPLLIKYIRVPGVPSSTIGSSIE